MMRQLFRVCVYPWWLMSLGLVFAQWIVPGSVASIGNPAYWLLGTSVLVVLSAHESHGRVSRWSYAAGVVTVLGWMALVLGPWAVSAQELWRGWIVLSAVVGVLVAIAALYDAED